MEEILHWPPDAWRQMGWREFTARWAHLHKRMSARESQRAQDEFYAKAGRDG